MKFYSICFILLFTVSVFASDYDEIKKLSLSSEGIENVEIDCGAGFLKVKGVEGLNEIRVKAEIEAVGASKDELEKIIKDHVELSLKKRGNRAVLISKFERAGSFLSFIFNANSNIKINLTVELPKKMNVEIDDGSGFIELENVNGNIEIDDGSGDLNINSIDGKIVIDDGSGDMDIKDVTGSLNIDDGSGDITVKEVRGNLVIEDGSGSLWASKIDGDVEIDDGSGSIHIDGVSKDVIIIDSGSGGVDIDNVKGNVYRHDD
jgi:DUF4097 and DUF4098 domain-containing protein YvlB